jgi:hypothetical protein
MGYFTVRSIACGLLGMVGAADQKTKKRLS